MGARSQQDEDSAPGGAQNSPSIPTHTGPRATLNVPPPSKLPPKPPAPPAAAAASTPPEPSATPSAPPTPSTRPSARPTAPPPPGAPVASLRGSLPPPEEHPVIGRFARFDVLGKLATGGMADLLLARQSLEGAGSRSVVIKVVRGEFAEDGAFAEMFLNEGRLAMRLSHPNICTVYECGRHQGRFFMAMEHVRGHTLRELVVRLAKKKQRLPIPETLRIFSIVAEALDYAHRARDAQGRPLRIVHRDVSPHNVMIRYDGIVKLLDFGVAKAERSEHSTEAGAVKGKFGYMSPEQGMSQPVDARSDVFALGVCLFEAVTGRRLFGRKTQYDTLKAILEEETPPPSAFREGVPPELDAIVARALEKDPARRYQSADDLRHDLDHLLADMKEVVSASRIGRLMESLFAAEMRAGPSLDTGADVRRRLLVPTTEMAMSTVRRRPPVALMAGLGVAALALLVGGLALLWPDDPPPAPAADDAPSTAAPSEPSRPEPPVAAPAAPQEAPEAAEAAAEAEPPEAAQEASATPPEDDTLAETPEDTEAAPSQRGASSEPRDSTTRRRSRPGRRRGGTVIVTDPGF